MKRQGIVLSLALLCLPLATKADVAPNGIQDFGAGGSRVPEFARQLLPEDFFRRSMVEPLANGHNYTATLELAGHRRQHRITADLGGGTAVLRSQALSAKALGMSIRLENRSGQANDVTVSALGGGSSIPRNFLVRLEPDAALDLDAASLVDADALYFLALSDFAVRVRLTGAGSETFDLTTLAPRVPRDLPLSPAGGFAKSSSPYCQDVTRTIRVCAVGGDCVSACGKRVYLFNSNGIEFYRAWVDYPYCGFPFHEWTGTGALQSAQTCQMYDYNTQRADGSGKEHIWKSLDETLIHCQGSTAQCVVGCNPMIGEPMSFYVTCQ